jgi:hypothetical protein
MATGDIPGVPERPPRRLRLPTVNGRLAGKAVIGALLVAYAWVAGGTSPFTKSSLLVVLLPAAVVGVIAYGRPVRRIPPPDRLDLTGSSYWILAIAALFEWEASAFRDFTDTWHPPLSNLVTPALGIHPLKTVAVLMWLLTGWGLLRR